MKPTTSDLVVRRADPGDFQAAYDIVREYSDAINVWHRDSEEEFAKYFQPEAGMWLATSEGAVVGCVAMLPLPAIANACEVKRLYVRPAWRGHGAARKLLAALHDHARAQGYHWCYLDSKSELETAIRLYFQLGYEEIESYNENPEATIFMRFRL